MTRISKSQPSTPLSIQRRKSFQSIPNSNPISATAPQMEHAYEHIEPDSVGAEEFFDPGLGDDSSVYTVSIGSSITDYQYENGRRYNRFREGNYVFPNDEHHMTSLLFDGKLHWAPIGKYPQNILDIGTGTGIWAISMANKHPSAHVIGTDLSPIQPRWVPQNVNFEIDDAESEWTYRQGTFDFIHTRYLTGSFADWPQFVNRCYKATKPDGWIEIQEIECVVRCDDGTLPPNSQLEKWASLIGQAADLYGRTVLAAPKLAGYVKDSGFKNITTKVFKIPTNDWPKNPRLKEIGAYQMLNMLDGLQALTLALFTRALGWEASQVELFLSGVRKEVKDRKIHSYANFYVVYGQKLE